MKKNIPLILSIFVAFVFLQSLYFKFSPYFFGEPADITQYIFGTIGVWMQSIGLGVIGELFGLHGGTVIGIIELVASVLILQPVTRGYGAFIGFVIISGAIFFHLFTPIGLFPFTDLSCLTADCPREYGLFFMALGVWFSCIYLMIQNKDKLLPYKK